MKYTVKDLSAKGTCKVTQLSHKHIKAGWQQEYLLRSDAHHDNVHCNWKLEKEHLDEAVARGAGIIDIGDLMCLMQGKWDRRADLSQCRPELQQGRYLDAVIDMCSDFYAPYAANFVGLGYGNHESSIERHHETHMTMRLIEAIRAKTGITIPFLGYTGWIKFMFRRDATRGGQTHNLRYHHGYGGGGPVTKGVIQTNRRATYLPDAAIIHTGHTHDSWIVPHARHRINTSGTVFNDTQWHVTTPGYKDEYSCGQGWHIERGGPPKPLGAAWLRFYLKNHDIRIELKAAT